VLDSYRLDYFPRPVRQLLVDAYVSYNASVTIPGFSFVGPGSAQRFDAFVTGT
jgi:hypothetical protein